MKNLTLIFGFILCLTGVCAAQRDFSATEIKTIPVAGTVTMIEGEGGNIAVSVGEDGVLMIDDQFAELNDRIIAAVRELTDQPLEFVLNTHWHGDHTGGNEQMRERGAHIVAHQNVRERLSTKQVRESSGRVDEARPAQALPVMTYEEAVTFHFNDETIEVIHFGPGHTDGDSIVFFLDSNVVHMGDLMFSGRFPFIDLDSGGDVDGYIEIVETVLDIVDNEVSIIPGHGSLSTRDDLVKFHEMMILSRDLVTGAIAEGKSLKEIQGLPFPEDFRDWGTGFINQDRWLETLYRYFSTN